MYINLRVELIYQHKKKKKKNWLNLFLSVLFLYDEQKWIHCDPPCQYCVDSSLAGANFGSVLCKSALVMI